MTRERDGLRGCPLAPVSASYPPFRSLKPCANPALLPVFPAKVSLHQYHRLYWHVLNKALYILSCIVMISEHIILSIDDKLLEGSGHVCSYGTQIGDLYTAKY